MGRCKLFKDDDDTKIFQYYSEHKVYCDCGTGHGAVFFNTHRDRLICPNCGHWIYKDQKTKLKYEMKKRGVLNENNK